MRHGSCMTFLLTQSASSKTEAFWHCPKARLEVLPLHCQLVRAGTRFPLPSLNAVCLLGLSLSRCQDWSLWLCRQGRSLCLLVLQGRSLCSWRRHRRRGWFSCRLSLRLCLQLLSCCLSLQKLRLCLRLLLGRCLRSCRVHRQSCVCSLCFRACSCCSFKRLLYLLLALLQRQGGWLRGQASVVSRACGAQARRRRALRVSVRRPFCKLLRCWGLVLLRLSSPSLSSRFFLLLQAWRLSWSRAAALRVRVVTGPAAFGAGAPAQALAPAPA